MSTPTIVPRPDPLSQPFWDAAREGRLRIQRCTACAHYHHPPQPSCSWCGSSALVFTDVEGRGRIHSHTSTLRRVSAPLAPYDTVVVVELDVQEGVLLVGRVPGERPGWAAIGARVHTRFETLGDTDVVLPQFEEESSDDE